MPVLAIGAVDVIALVAALAIILLLWAGQYFFGAIGAVLSHVPIVGPHVANTLNNWVGAAMEAAVAVWDGLTQPLAHFFWMLGTGTWHLLYNLVGTIANVNNVAHTALNEAAGAAAAISGAVAAGVAEAENFASALDGQAVARADDLFNLSITTAEGYADTVAGEVLQDAQTLYSQAVGVAQGLYNDAIGHADTVAGEADADAHALYNQAVGVAEGLYNDAVAYTNTVSAELFQDITGVQGEAQDLYNQAITVAPALALAQVLPRVEALEAEATECVEPLCDTVVPNASQLGKIGQFLNNLEQLGIDAFIVALAAEAVTDPQAVVADVTGVIQDVGGPILTGFRDLIGV